MKVTAILILIPLSLMFFECRGQSQASHIKTDTITFEVKDIKPSSDSLAMDSCENFYHLIIYTPIKCNVGFTDKKPPKDNNNIKFCVPAAFTSKELTFVVGDYIVDGRFVGQSSDVETGYCAIINGRVIIRPLDERVEKHMIRAVETKGDFFRQMLLIYESKIVQCTIFDKYRPTYRRALVEKGGESIVVESEERVSIYEFQLMLQKIGVKNAIYLDMGTWSEGFYRNEFNELIPIGKQTQSTKHQTNWLFFEKK